MRDYPALKPCRAHKRGRHRGTSWVTLDEEGQAHFGFVCRACGAARLASPEAFETLPPLDARDAETIARAAGLAW